MTGVMGLDFEMSFFGEVINGLVFTKHYKMIAYLFENIVQKSLISHA